jgi:hypothetical protein
VPLNRLVHGGAQVGGRSVGERVEGFRRHQISVTPLEGIRLETHSSLTSASPRRKSRYLPIVSLEALAVFA